MQANTSCYAELLAENKLIVFLNRQGNRNEIEITRDKENCYEKVYY